MSSSPSRAGDLPTDGTTSAPPRRKNLLRFSLRTLFVIVTIIAAWLAGWVSRPNRELAALEQLADSHVIRHGKLVELRTFKPLTERDAGLLHRLTDLRRLGVTGWQITDESLTHLSRIKGLEALDVRNTQVTDRGLRSLAGLISLKELSLSGTGVTDAGLDELKGMNRLETLFLDGTAVTDKGLASLKALPSLKVVTLHSTAVTVEGIQELKRTLPGIKVTWDAPANSVAGAK